MRHIITFLLVVSSSALLGQELFVDWAVPYRRSSTIIKLLPQKGLDFFVYKLSSRNILQTPRVTRYEHGQPLETRRIDQKIESNMVVLDELIMFGNTLTGFFRDKRDGANSLYMIKYDQEGEPYGEPIQISTFPFSKKGEGKGSFNLIKSKNGRFLCVEYIIPARRDLYDRYGYTVLDSTFSVLGQGEYEIPYSQNDARVDMRFLSDRSDYILGMSVYNGSNSITDDYSSIEKTVVVQVHQDTVSQYEMLIDDKRIFDIGMNFQDGFLTVTGTYGEAFAIGAEGVFMQKIDLDKRMLNSSYITAFPRDFMTKNMTANQLDRIERNEATGGSGPQLMNYSIREVHGDSDGSTIVVAEQYIVYQQSSTDMRGLTQAVYQYYYNDLLIYRVDSTGMISWIIDVPKEQQSVNDYGYFSSEVSFLSAGKLNIIFNDNRKNYDEFGDYSGFSRTAVFPSRKSSYALAHVAVDVKNGETKRRVLNDYNQTNGLVVMQLTSVDHNRREVLFFSSGSQESFGLLRF